MSLRIVFMGTPEFSVPTLSAILDAGHEVAAVYTQPPRKAGRGMAARLSPVHAFANDAGLEVVTTPTLKDPNEQRGFAAAGADVAVVVAYGLILPKAILEAPREGCLNLHASMLPRWRGAAPIQRAIMAGDEATGICVMRMEEGLDTGPVCLAEQVPIGPDETAGALHDRLARLGADLMVRALSALSRGALNCTAQKDNGVTYAAKIDKAEARIDWSRPASEVHNHIRGLSPWPGAWFSLDGKAGSSRIKVIAATLAEGNGAPGTLLDDALTVACGDGAVRLVTVQREGRQAMGAEEFLRGQPLGAGARLS